MGIKKMIEKIKRFVEHRRESLIQYCMMNFFIDKNKNMWQDEDKPCDKNIYIANAMHNMYEYLYRTILFAKGMESNGNYKIWVLNSKKDILFKRFCSSFNVNGIILNNSLLKKYLENMLTTVKVLQKIKRGMDILQYRYRGILIGPSIYDTILLNTGRGTYNNTINRDVYKIISNAITIVDNVMFLFENKYPDILIVMEEAYESEIYRRVAQHYGGRIIWVSVAAKEYVDINGKSTIYSENIVKREINEALKLIGQDISFVEKVDLILKEYYEKGNIIGIRGRTLSGNAVKGKYTADKQEIEEVLKLKKNKKNVFIFSHCMTDGPHACPELLYRDYYVWLEETLKIAVKVKDVNWIVKFHPDRFWRKGKESIETNKIIENFGQYDNIFFYPDEYSLLSVVNIADVIITARGKVGEEMSCYGMPVITAGKPYYSVWGYTYTYDSAEEYEECLYNVARLDRLSEREILLAKKVFWAHTISTQEFDRDIIMKYIVEADRSRREGVIGRRVNINFLNAVSDESCLSMMKNSSLYLEGINF